MFKNLKLKIKELARKAVFIAESQLGSGKGQEKKKLAIDYIVRNLPLPIFIDDVIEISVSYMKSLPAKEGE